MQIIDAAPRHLPGMLAIYNQVVADSAAIYRDDPATAEERAAWIADRQGAGFPVIVAEDADGAVLGYASYGPWRGAFPGYRFTVEHTIMIRDGARGRGLGRALMEALEARARAQGIHVMLGSVDADNPGSIALHEKLGFKVVARHEQVGAKFGRWLDMVFLQKILDDRAAPPE
ncbi:N-acetyltransferase family protein [Rhodovulum sp. DZ06]|uniref:GNAT family N-acetyltransferase n=1 Tax=Rhodovulum sp. DZ06 TaxID=3425126 RepID=UPI003D334D3F